MHRYFKRKGESEEGSASKLSKVDFYPKVLPSGPRLQTPSEDFDPEALPSDPGLRTPIEDFDRNLVDLVRRTYVQRGPCQPKEHKFELVKGRRFNISWYDEFGSWLEYSKKENKVYCLCCYLFKPSSEKGGGDSFVGEGFQNYKKKERLYQHVGGPSSSHNQAWAKYESLKNHKQHLEGVFARQKEKVCNDYQIRLSGTLEVVRLLLRQGMAFRGHDESKSSNNRGNFIEILKVLAKHDPEIKAVALENAPGNCKLISSDIQKDCVSACAAVTMKAILKDLGDSLFSILVDESRDVSMKEQMAVILRYVNKRGEIIERFLGVEHVASTTSLSLKAAIDKMFARHGLSLSRLRGQGYDGASNMQGEFNGLKALILKENQSAFYIHCFAHQLQLALVGLAKNNDGVANLFLTVNGIINVVGSSAIRCDILREKHKGLVLEAVEDGVIESGRGLNQESNLQRAGDIRWGSHYGSLISVLTMFSAVSEVLEYLSNESNNSTTRIEAHHWYTTMLSFEFVLSLHVMISLLGITDDLSKALQRKDQDIINAMSLVKVCKKRLQDMRDNGWDALFEKVYTFCTHYSIDIPSMESQFVPSRGKRKINDRSNLEHYKIEVVNAVIDTQLQELNDRFNEATTELLLCVACLSPKDSFASFDVVKLIKLSEFYPMDFSVAERIRLEGQLQNYIHHVRLDDHFCGIEKIGDLTRIMVETGKEKVFPLVYRLLTLAFTLPIATASVERSFSSMKFVKTDLRNKMGDGWLNDLLFTYVEKDVFNEIDDEPIMIHFQNMKTRRGQL